MLIFVAAWLFGGVAFMFGCRWLLHVKHAKFDHEERMAEIRLERARLDEEIAKGRAERASRTRPDLVEALAAIDASTEVFPRVPAPDQLTDPADELVDELVDAEPEYPPDREDVLAEPGGAGEWPSVQDNDAADSARHRLPSTL